MLLTIATTFIATSAIYSLAVGFALWRVGCHLRGDNYATGMVVEHVLLPILGRRKVAAPPAVETPAPANNGVLVGVPDRI